MERKQALKLQDPIISMSFSDHFQSGNNPLTDLLDFSDEGEKGSLGFMELLGIQDLSHSIFDTMLQVPEVPSIETPAQTETSTVPESSELFNQPTTPNSSSISSASNDEQTKEVDEEQQKTKKQLKPKKTSQKKQRVPRFAFMTKSEVDHLEDGYRWRKYGQKAVKNSPFPRGYYRCTSPSCIVKKRVERSFSDPSIVVTTYEGQHTHPSPVMPQPRHAGMSAGAATAPSQPVQMTQLNNYSYLNCSYMSSTNSFHENRFWNPGTALLTDHGLLQDLVPSTVKKEE